MKKFEVRTSAIFMTGLFLASAFLVSSSASAIPPAPTDLSAWCTGTGLSYSSGTCSVTGTGGTIGMSVNVEISNGETLSLATAAGTLEIESVTLTIDQGGKLVVIAPSCSFAECLVNDGTISNSGNITTNNAAGGSGIYNSGALVNMGTITIKNSAVTGQGIYNTASGTVTNTASGAILLENTGGESFGIQNDGTVTNSGSLTAVSASSLAAQLSNDGTFTNYGIVKVTGSGNFAIEQGSSAQVGTFNNYGTITNVGTTTDPFDNFYGVLNEECGDIVTGITSFEGTVNPYACGPAFLNIQSALTSIENSFSGLSSALSGDYNSLATDISNLQTTVNSINTGVNGLSGTLSTLTANIAADYSSLSSGISGLSTALSTDFSSLSSAIANIGSTGPLAGTSEGTTVASASVTPVSAPGSLPTGWTQITTASSNEVVTGFSVSTTKGSITQGVLYVTWSNGATTGSVFAIPAGDLGNGATVNGVTSPHFSIPAGATVYVQLVSSSKANADVQLQFAGLPISGP